MCNDGYCFRRYKHFRSLFSRDFGLKHIFIIVLSMLDLYSIEHQHHTILCRKKKEKEKFICKWYVFRMQMKHRSWQWKHSMKVVEFIELIMNIYLRHKDYGLVATLAFRFHFRFALSTTETTRNFNKISLGFLIFFFIKCNIACWCGNNDSKC